MNIDGKNIGAAGNVNIGTQNNYFGNSPQPLPNSIPSSQNFVGRENYLVELRESYQEGKRCFVLHGTGGVGKSALALRFAEEIAGEYAAKVFVEMNGMSDHPLSVQDAMFAVVRQFEREIPTDISPVRLRELFNQFVQNQQTLIVLDNVKNVQSVEALKQARACFITTSREAFTLTGGKSQKISQMSPDDARKLLFEIVDEKRFDGRADELANLAGYLPMAIKPLASILAENELQTAANLIDKYQDKKALLEERVPDYNDLTIEASFELSYEALPSDELRDRWRRLSVFPNDFDEAAITAILEISPVEAEKTQTQLRRFSLLEVNRKTRRFNLHDLIRVFSDTKLSDDERFQVQFLHAQHYVSVLVSAQNKQTDKEENYYLNALKIIDTEWTNILAGQKWTATYIEKQEIIAKLCADYCDYARTFTTLRLSPRESIRWLEAGLSGAKKLNNREREGNNLGNLGSAYLNLGDRRKAVEFHEQSLTIAREIGKNSMIASCLGNLGIVYTHLLNEPQKAIDCYEASLPIFQTIGNRQAESNCLCNLGNAYTKLNNYRKAIEYYKQYSIISHQIGDKKGEGNSLNNLGNAYAKLGEPHKSIKYYERSLVIKRELNDRLGQGNSLASLGNTYDYLGERKKACSLWKEALIIFESIESSNANIVRKMLENYC